MYSKTIYNFVGGMMGYVLCPVALAGLGMPLCLRLFRHACPVLAIVFFWVAVLIALGNVYLCARHGVTGEGASYFPVFFSLAAIPAWILSRPAGGMSSSAGIVLLILSYDFLGQGILGAMVARYTKGRI